MEELKARGTAAFQAGDYAGAIAKYEEALSCAGTPIDAQCVLLSNIAMCHLKLAAFPTAITAVDRALALAPSSQLPSAIMEKLLFRRAQAYMETEQLTQSALDLKAVLQIAPGNKPAQALLRALQEKARKDASGVGKALKALPAADALNFLEHHPAETAPAIYRDLLELHGERTLWTTCVANVTDASLRARGLRILGSVAKHHGGAVLAAIDMPLLAGLVPVPFPSDAADSTVTLVAAVIGLAGVLATHVATAAADVAAVRAPVRQLLDIVFTGLRSDVAMLQQASLDVLLKHVLQTKAPLPTLAIWMEEMGLFALLLAKANILHESTVSSVAMVFSQLLAPFPETDMERLVRDYCVAPVVAATSMEEAAPGCVLLSGVFLANAKLGSHMMQSHPAFLRQLSDVLLRQKSMAYGLKYQELVMDLVAYIAGSEAGMAAIPIELRMELGKLLQCEMEPHQLKLQSAALAAVVKMSLVDKTFDPTTPVGEIMVDQVLSLLERVHTAPVAAAVVGSTARERAVEALSYVITFTPVKDALVRRPAALAPLLTDVSAATTPSNLLYGVSYILFHLLTSESHLKRQKMMNSELTPEQYEELQKALKQKSELEDGDSPAQVATRIAAVLEHPQGILTLLQLLKCKGSPAILDQATQSVLHATEYVEGRGKLVQGGLLAAMLSLASFPAQHAVAKILITTNPHLIPAAQLLSAVHPLMELLKHKSESTLAQFEGLMALTNIASVSDDTKRRILSNNGLATIQYLQFSDHKMVRRAATECLTNLLPSDEVLEKVFCQPDKARLWLAFASIEEAEEDFETARAAAGAIAMVSQYPEVCAVLLEQKAVETFAAVILGSDSPELVHRHLFATQMCLEYVGTMETPGAEARGRQAMYEQQLLLLEAPIGLAGRKFAQTSPEIVEIATACLGLLAKLK
ncbi:unc-45 family protein [Achlya hypogyna]|uniref:Unc-45 family protein n=1 Tax=Achlya hypogyna TaxID=1202772 RepID=A0A1V9YCN5_ACHHY|nr:unc-45 family protein [Achlya hypogyna]